MTVNAPVNSPAQPKPSEPGSTAQLIVWLAAQLVVLILCAARVPLAARYPEPAEQLAPHLLLCTQLIVASLLFPWLLNSARLVVTILATALPFQLASAFLAGIAARQVLGAVLFVDCFVIALGLWSPLLRSNWTQSLAIACASCLTLGGGMLRYLRVEYSGGLDAAPLHSWETAAPLPSTTMALSGHAPLGGWILVAILAFAATVLHVVGRQSRPAHHDVTPANKEI